VYQAWSQSEMSRSLIELIGTTNSRWHGTTFKYQVLPKVLNQSSLKPRSILLDCAMFGSAVSNGANTFVKNCELALPLLDKDRHHESVEWEREENT
jgi:hypothetical protein